MLRREVPRGCVEEGRGERWVEGGFRKRGAWVLLRGGGSKSGDGRDRKEKGGGNGDSGVVMAF